MEPGHSLSVGRASRADLAFRDDSHMSAVHFEVACEDKGCMLRDLDSTNGTWVNGARVTTVPLANGDTVVAGETTFAVQIIAEQAEAPAAVAAAAPTPQQKLLAMLRGEFQPLYAVLDAAREPEVLKVLVESKEECRSLYEGAQGAQLAHFAPYLVRLPKESPLLETLVEKGWGNSWGVYLTCASELQEVRQHLRRFLEAQLPEGKQVYFRFYDPRVLRVFLPTCTAYETNQFFGPIKHYLMEDDKPDKLLQFGSTDKGAEVKVIDLSPPAAGEDKRPPSSPGVPTLTWMDKLTPDEPR